MESSKINIRACEICGSYATSLCFKCISYFCDSCYKFVHEKEQNSKHIKENIDPYVPIYTKCPDHPKIIMNLFCNDEKGKFIYFLIIYFLLNKKYYKKHKHFKNYSF